MSDEVAETYHDVPRSFTYGVKLDFPRFCGQDPSAWIYRVNQYFTYHQTPMMQNVFIASSHMDDEALMWFQDATEAGAFPLCEEIVEAIQVRYGSSAYDELMEALTWLKLVTTISSNRPEF